MVVCLRAKQRAPRVVSEMLSPLRLASLGTSPRRGEETQLRGRALFPLGLSSPPLGEVPSEARRRGVLNLAGECA
jgi:hypothetical protein